MSNCENHAIEYGMKSDRIGWDGDHQKFSLVLPASLASGNKTTEDGDKGDGSTAGSDDLCVKQMASKCLNFVDENL